jgi:hypothetical protein
MSQVPYAMEAEIVLAMWRDVARGLARSIPGSAHEAGLRADADRLRSEYQRLVELARAHHRPEPAPFPQELI